MICKLNKDNASLFCVLYKHFIVNILPIYYLLLPKFKDPLLLYLYDDLNDVLLKFVFYIYDVPTGIHTMLQYISKGFNCYD